VLDDKKVVSIHMLVGVTDDACHGKRAKVVMKWIKSQFKRVACS
jgi:hypothetical protein